MAIDEGLRDELRAHLEGVEGVAEKAMFGGAGFMLRGNLLCGVMGDELLVRLGKEDGAGLVGEDGAHPMVMGARSSKGWILVPMPPAQRGHLLTKWVQRGLSHVSTLPAK